MLCAVAVPLPDAPLGVQVEAGPQRGTLLVTWTPVPDKKPVDEEAAALIRAITGYAVYVDGTMVKQLDSPSGQYSFVVICALGPLGYVHGVVVLALETQ